jgi:putative transcriptional regulator
MWMPKRYRSDVMQSIHQTAADLYAVGGMDKKTMRKFDVLCLTPIQEMSPKKIRALRTREKASQTVFAAYLNVTPSLVSKWERGEKHPQGASLKLLSLIDKKGLEVIA